jgi:hypothetical protein
MLMLKTAKQYIKLGWKIFPLHTVKNKKCSCGKNPCTDAGKHPRLERGVKEASNELEKIELWFGKDSPPSNIGIATGEVSGITVLDIDIGEGKKGAESWVEVIKDKGEPDTLIAETGSGGTHIIFQYNSALKTSSNTLGEGVDCRNDGGYIVGAPSKHSSGGVYSWLNWGKKIAVLPAHLAIRKETRGRKAKGNLYKNKYTISQVADMLEMIPSDDRDLWRYIGIVLGREFKRSDEAWVVYEDWAAKAGGKAGRNHSEIMREAFYDISQQQSDKNLSLGTIIKLAIENGWSPKAGDVPVSQFVFFGPGNNFIYRPTISLWISSAVDAAVSPVNDNGKIGKASDWLKLNQLATSMACDPALDTDYIKGYDNRDGEIIPIVGAAVFNSYRKPTIELGDAKLAQPFLKHVNKVFNKEGDAQQFLNYMAHRVQRPEEKPRFALLIAGGQGVGKDTAIEFCCPAIGIWNVANIDPAAFESNFNEFASKTLIRISEAANLHEMSKWAFNERTKVLIGGSPDTCEINPKYGQKWTVRMYCGVIITTNHLASGIYIPEDDRRYDVIESSTLKEMGLSVEKKKIEYFIDLWDWFLKGGAPHVAAYLHEHDIKKFSASNGQRKTSAHKTVIAGGLVSDQWLDDIIDGMGEPVGMRADWIITEAEAAGEKVADVKRKLSNSIGRLGYCIFRNPKAKDGRWKIENKKVTVYVKTGTPADYNPHKQLTTKEPF